MITKRNCIAIIDIKTLERQGAFKPISEGGASAGMIDNVVKWKRVGDGLSLSFTNPQRALHHDFRPLFHSITVRGQIKRKFRCRGCNIPVNTFFLLPNYKIRCSKCGNIRIGKQIDPKECLAVVDIWHLIDQRLFEEEGGARAGQLDANTRWEKKRGRSNPNFPDINLFYRNPESDRELRTFVTFRLNRRYVGPPYLFHCGKCPKHKGDKSHVDKLYLPPGKNKFKCRDCHDIKQARRTTVEECLTANIKDVIKQGAFKDAPKRIDGGILSGGVSWSRDADGSIMLTAQDSETSREINTTALAIRSNAKPRGKKTMKGQGRYLWRCQACNEHMAQNLYLPPGGRAFACRHCYKLANRSSQDVRKPPRPKKKRRGKRQTLPFGNP